MAEHRKKSRAELNELLTEYWKLLLVTRRAFGGGLNNQGRAAKRTIFCTIIKYWHAGVPPDKMLK
jgi:hypothetical protein